MKISYAVQITNVDAINTNRISLFLYLKFLNINFTISSTIIRQSKYYILNPNPYDNSSH